MDAIVEVFEKVGPRIRERLRGTALEAVYDDLGPGFQFLTASSSDQYETVISMSPSCTDSRPR